MAIKNLFPEIKPSLNLDFANTKQLDPRITFTRATSGTYYDAQGVMQTAPAGVARFDHNPVTGESLGLLIEESRTNLLLDSEAFLTATRASVVPAAVIAPNGTLTGSKLVEDTSVDLSHVTGKATGITGTVSAYSVYAKAAERHFVVITHAGTSIFDLSNGAIAPGAGATCSIQNVGNGWFRCTVVGAAPSTTYVGVGTNMVSGQYTGDGTSGIYIWGAQLEVGSFATSYIPTTSAQVTRAIDDAAILAANFSPWYRQNEGTLLAEFSVKVIGTGQGISISDGTTSNKVRMVPSSGTQQGTVIVGGVTQALLDGGTPAPDVLSTYALAYRTNDFALSMDGATPGTDAAGDVPTNVSRMRIGGDSTYTATGHFKRLAYYPKRLTDTQLQTLTA